MSKELLDEREFELINIIGAQMAKNQRELSKELDLSLGQTNILIRRLISKGYIRIQQLNKKKVQYLLTPKGISEKTHKMIKYTVNTLQSLGTIKKRLKVILQNLYTKNHREFVILGNEDIVALIKFAIHDLKMNNISTKKINCVKDFDGNGVLLICKEDVIGVEEVPKPHVDMLKEIAMLGDYEIGS
ncbi:MAG: winged helix-turn-helix transcriptional regulator [Candidatus Omnitrophica bacterium]|nr:winged helix-turn-helix transcriptional regulator [Candidatus Omnitrophota bacterium]